MKTATSAEGLLYTFTYDVYGNNTKVEISGSGLTISSEAAYTEDFNRIASVTDALGKITRYSYNENTNVLEWVQKDRGRFCVLSNQGTAPPRCPRSFPKT